MNDLRRKLILLVVSVLVALAVALGAADRSQNHDRRTRNDESALATHFANERKPIPSQTPESVSPQAAGPIDSHVIAGGGGTSSSGSITLNGTVGETSASNTQSNGQFTVNGGFWNTLTQTASSSPTPSASPSVSPTSTPTPTATPTATPTPSPNPSAPTIFVEQETDLLAALDSVTFLRGPFTLTDDHNFSSDHRTRIIFFTTNLGFTQTSQPDLATLSVEVGGFSLPVESVGPLSFAGVDASYVVFRLPDLPPGNWPLSIRLRGVGSSNSPILVIASAPP